MTTKKKKPKKIKKIMWAVIHPCGIPLEIGETRRQAISNYLSWGFYTWGNGKRNGYKAIKVRVEEV